MPRGLEHEAMFCLTTLLRRACWLGSGLLLWIAACSLSGCGERSTAVQKGSAAAHGEHAHGEHGHPTEGPHHGSLIELGNEAFHAEWVPDTATGEIDIYILDGSAQTEVPIDGGAAVINLFIDGVPQQIHLVPQFSHGDTEGATSQFRLPASAWTPAAQRAKGRGELRVLIQGRSYRGPVPKP